MKKEIREESIETWILILVSVKEIDKSAKMIDKFERTSRPEEDKNWITAQKALKKLKVSPEEIEKRIAEYEKRDPAVEVARLEAKVAAYSPPPISKGYAEGGKLAQVYVLECSHQIRASKRVGILSKGLLGKVVLCETCGASRKVVSAPSWVR